jgi:histidinol-phosphate/aromatic aminotransferase/cobyric acid decarboxylase-like protein
LRKKLNSRKRGANFFYFRAKDPVKLKKLFQKNGVSIRIFNHGAAKGFARITVGKPAENRLVMKILARGV